MTESLQSLAGEINGELDPSLADGERVLIIVKQLRIARPDTTSKGRLKAATDATGAPSMTEAEMDEAIEGVDARRPSRRARRAAALVGRRAPAARGIARDVTRAAGRSVTSPARTARGLVFQSLGLVALYWFITNAGAIAKIINGVNQAFGWLKSTRGIPG